MMKVKINFTPYYEWYAKWIDWKKVSVNDFVNGKIENPFGMLDEWLDIISIKPTQNDIGKEIYYSLNALQRNEITYDTYLEGCVIKKGVITDISKNILQIDGKDYIYSQYNTVLFDCSHGKFLWCRCSCYTSGNLFPWNQRTGCQHIPVSIFLFIGKAINV